MKNFEYKAMTIDDYDQVFKIWNETAGIGVSEADTLPKIQKFLERNEGLSFVCKDDGKVVGTVMAGHDGRRGFIYHLAVIPEYRGKGIANELIRNCLERLAAAGIDKCHLFVMKGNESGKNFWRKSGWEERGDIVVFSKKNQG